MALVTVCAQVRPSAITIDALSVPIGRLAPPVRSNPPTGTAATDRSVSKLTTPVSMPTLKINSPLEAAPVALFTVS